jgi:hypothetical protein
MVPVETAKAPRDAEPALLYLLLPVYRVRRVKVTFFFGWKWLRGNGLRVKEKIFRLTRFAQARRAAKFRETGEGGGAYGLVADPSAASG